jgi:hypothetical protein
MKSFIAIIAALFILSSCATLSSTTFIKPMDSFILGNNQHGSFKVRLENTSPSSIEVYLSPINGGKHSFQTVNPKEIVSVKVAANTALVIQNKSGDTASVNLKATGDVGLSMGYKN